MRICFLAVASALLLATVGRAGDFEAERRAMVENLRGRGVKDARLLRAMQEVPRHLFLDKQYAAQAYADKELPIGEGQVIWQPYLVALTTELARPRPTDKALEVGTGCGYHAAVLSQLCERVYTIEIVPSLARSAQERLRRLGYPKVTVKQGDGYRGWPERQPFDVIIVTCAAEEVPMPLVEQLREGGRMVIPVSDRGKQTLTLLQKTGGVLRAVSIRKVKLTTMRREETASPPAG